MKDADKGDQGIRMSGYQEKSIGHSELREKKYVETVNRRMEERRIKVKTQKNSLVGLITIFLVLTLTLTLAVYPGHAAIPQTINYQGYLTNAAGVPVNGTLQIVFSIYNVPAGGAPLWTETQTVSVSHGVYSVNLGDGTPLGLTFNAPYYLGVQVGVDAEMTPRKVLTSVGYAFRALTVESVGNHTHSGADITSGTVSESRIDPLIARDSEVTTAVSAHASRIDNPHSTTAAQVGAALAVHSHSATEITSGTFDNARFSAYSDLTAEGYLDNNAGADLLTQAQGDARYVNEGQASSIASGMISVPLSLSGSVASGVVISGNNDGTGGRGIYGQASGTSGFGVQGEASNTGTETNYGGYFTAAGTTGVGVRGYAANSGNVTNTGGAFIAMGTSGRGVYGSASNTGTGTNHGGFFTAAGTTGVGVRGSASNSGDVINYGGSFYAWGTHGRGVYGEASNTGTGTNYGGYFTAEGSTFSRGVYGGAGGTSGVGVFGQATNTGTGTNYGGYFEASGSSGRGVYGSANNNGDVMNIGGYFKASGTDGLAVYGAADNAGNATNYGGYFVALGTSGRGVYGYASNTGTVTNHGGYFEAAGTYGEGVRGTASGTYGQGVYGYASNTGTGENYGGYFFASGTSGRGVRGEASGTSGRGVYGVASHTGNYINYGGYFEASGTSGRGVYGRADGASGQGVRGYGSEYDFYAAGSGVDYGSSSSIRWKRNIQEIDGALSKIMTLRGVYFDWDEEHGGQHGMGFIAEEVGTVIPEIVAYESDGVYATGVDYGAITPMLVQAIKEQQKQIEELKAQINELRKRLD